MRSIGGCIALSQTRQMGTQYNTWHIPHTALKGSSPHDMSCPSKGITLCQSLIGTQGKFLCNTNTRALHSKVILTHAISWPKSYNANSTLLTMIHYARRTCGDTRRIKLPKLRQEYCEYIPRFLIVISRKRHEI